MRRCSQGVIVKVPVSWFGGNMVSRRGGGDGGMRARIRARSRKPMVVCKWTNRGGWGEIHKVFCFFFVWPSLCLYLFSIHLLSFWSNHVFSLFFSPPQFFPIILLCGKQNLSEGRSIMLRCNSVAGYAQGGRGKVGWGGERLRV